MENSRQSEIEGLACDGKLPELKKLIECGFTQTEIDTALADAIAYSQLSTAEYLLSLGANMSSYDYNGVYYAVHNNELKGLKFSISKGVDVNISNGLLLNTSIFTSTNTGDIKITRWLLENGANPKLLTRESLQMAKRYGTNELKSLLKQYLPLKFLLS